jgi:hypothetical protein
MHLEYPNHSLFNVLILIIYIFVFTIVKWIQHEIYPLKIITIV